MPRTSPPRIYGELAARLTKELKTATGNKVIPAGAVVLLQFSPDTPVTVLYGIREPLTEIVCCFKELAGAEIL